MDYETLDPGFRFQGRQALSGATGLPDTGIYSSSVQYFMELGPIGQGNSAPRCQFSSLPGSVRGDRSSWRRDMFKKLSPIDEETLDSGDISRSKRPCQWQQEKSYQKR